MELAPTHLACLTELLEQGTDITDGLPWAIGDTETCESLWRFYSNLWPTGGIGTWNATSAWKRKWEPLLPPGAYAFGEDIFGNQLIVIRGENNVFLWNHENGDCADLYCDPVTLLTTVLNDGIDWVDQYCDGSLTVARQFSPISRDSHLHWTTPLILGGVVRDSNISVVERESHLAGHAELWSQLRGLPFGTSIIPK